MESAPSSPPDHAAPVATLVGLAQGVHQSGLSCGHPSSRTGGPVCAHSRSRLAEGRAWNPGVQGCQVAAMSKSPGLQCLKPVCLSVSAEKHFLRRSRSGDILAKNPVVRSKSYNTPLLNPVAEHEAEGAVAGGTGIRRHSVSEMTSCPDAPGPGPVGDFTPSSDLQPGPCPSRLYADRSSPPSSSPENLVDQVLESVDSDSEGIFIDFGRRSGPGASELEGDRGRQSIV